MEMLTEKKQIKKIMDNIIVATEAFEKYGFERKGNEYAFGHINVTVGRMFKAAKNGKTFFETNIEEIPAQKFELLAKHYTY